jgi:endonuclease/exonuclease/phosphatase family metal-dependent hydrolase
MRIVTWNVQESGPRRVRAQLAVLLERQADLLALQAVSMDGYEAWHAGLEQEGYSVVDAAELARIPYPPPPYPRGIEQRQIKRGGFHLTAARYPIVALPGLQFDDPDERRLAFPEKFVAAEVDLSGRVIEVHNAGAPPGSSRRILKPQALAAVVRRLEVRAQVPQILCGDFNTPQPEQEGEPVRTFAEFYPDLEAMWDAAERGILEHPRLRDAYKQVHKPGDPWPYSYRVQNSKDPKQRRYDHIYVSDHFEVHTCRYLIDWLAPGLSDHAGVEAEITLHG